MTRRLALLALLPLVAACGGERRDGSDAPIRLLEAARCEVWAPAERALPGETLPVEVVSVPLPGRAGRVIMHAEGDGRDARIALIAPTGSRYQASVTLPRNDPVLQVGLGYLLEPTPPDLALRFRVRLTPAGGEPVELLGETLTTSADGRWADREIPLRPWAGERVRLDFLTEGPPDGTLVWAGWGAPEIFDRRRAPAGWNVILVVLDTLRADHLGCYGYQRPTSPALDALSSRSFRFAAAFSQSSWTRPSHRSIFSGLYPLSRQGLTSPPLAEVLWTQGYRTQAITGGAQLAYQFGFSRGFEKHEIARWVRSIDEVVDLLESDRGRKHFLFLHTYEIHDPYEHDELAAGLAPGRLGATFQRATLARLGRSLTAQEKAYVEALYDSGIRYTDASLGRLLDRLERSRLLDRTLLIVTSDHGEGLWDRGRWGHGRAMFDEQIHVPLIVDVPPGMRDELRLPAGPRVIRQQVRLVDLYPTILDLLGTPVDHPIQGRSLRPLLSGDSLPARAAFSEALYFGPIEVKALRGERYKYMRGIAKKRDDPLDLGWEALFDLRADPLERIDVKTEAGAVFALMRAEVDHLLEGGAAATEDEVPADLDPAVKKELRALGYVD